MVKNHTDTIAAIITPPGRGGVGIIRVCGGNLDLFFTHLLATKPSPRKAIFTPFLDSDSREIDRGLALYFPAPGSFTGEETLELHAHGSPVVLDLLLQRIINLGARQARPGEFSERAFLNDKLDLAQAEAIADLIDAVTEEAARGAVRTLKGDFSKLIQDLLAALTHLRVYVEAAIDFPEEELDFLSDGKVEADLDELIARIKELLSKANQGVLLREGMTVVIAGRPNAGKSSLLNALSGVDRAIVTDIPGTTRDVLKEQINIDGLPLHIVDTAGLRDSIDLVEQAGIGRAWEQISEADSVLWVVDSRVFDEHEADIWPEYRQRFGDRNNVTVVVNKTDLLGDDCSFESKGKGVISVSALTGYGMDDLRAHLKAIAGFSGQTEGTYSARRRHIVALESTQYCLVNALQQLKGGNPGGELIAEDLRLAQDYLGQITGVMTSDDLLGEIFSSFCIGK
ncbi:MAG: tRNA uridine-5-carboxymethylaminomethyl(34) synthesis GTPase MnmE [Porticoccaceae bacterium]|nr:tRNA uridine-5-carboxymethylaminomethyl(34) synthesis GTPase MnmE [Porticoccaceae bacterium]